MDIQNIKFVAREFKPGDIDISANQDKTYHMVNQYMQELCAYLKAEHEHKLATYGFVRRNLYLLKFHFKNLMYTIKHGKSISK